MVNVKITDEAIEKAAWDLVRKGTAPNERNLLEWVRDEANRQANPPRPSNEMFVSYTRMDASPEHARAVQRVLWKFIINRVLVPGDYSTGSCLSWDRTTLAANFAGADPLPADPRYLAGLEQDGLDDIGRHYLREAVRCHNAGAFTAAMAMLGVGSEHVIDELMAAYANSTHSAPTLAAKLAKERQIKPRFDVFMTDFEPKSKQILKDAGIRDSSFQFVTGVFDTIRLDRNEAGHPSGREFDAQTVEGHLLLFRSNFRRCILLTRHFLGSPRP